MTNFSQRIRDYYDQVDHSLGIDPARGTLASDDARVGTVMQLFSPHAVYERGHWGTLEGADALDRFFRHERGLCGQHRIDSVKEAAGITEEAAEGMKRHFSAIAPSRCRTVTVEGCFSGAQCFTGPGRFVESASGLEVPFVDHWVIAGDQVVYRKSELMMAAAMAADMQQSRRRSSGTVGR